jgi:serine/threonine-protein kinase
VNRGAPDDEYLADGMTDDLIDSLSMAGGLRVRSRGAVMNLKNEPHGANRQRDPRKLGRELGVHVVVDGSVRRNRELLRVSIRLVSVGDGFQLWAKRFERPAADVFEMGDEIARAIAETLDIERGERGVEYMRDPVTVDLYLRARHAYYAFAIPEITRALSLFEAALARAPDDPVILSGYAMASMARLGMQEGSAAAFNDALVLAERAVALAPELAEAHVALANIRAHGGRHAEAAPEARLALQIAPSNADAHLMIGRLYGEAWRPAEALAHLATVQTLDPRVRMASAERSRIYALLGEWDNAEVELSRIRVVDENAVFLYWGTRMRYTMWRRDDATTKTSIEEALAGPARDHHLIRSYAILLETRSSEKFEASLSSTFGDIASTVRRQAFVRQLQAEAAAFCGYLEPCIAAIENAGASGLTDLGWIDHCPLLAFARTDPRFTAVRERVAGRAAVILEALA